MKEGNKNYDEIWKIMEKVGSKKKKDMDKIPKNEANNRAKTKIKVKDVIKGIIIWSLNIGIRGLFYGTIFYLASILLSNGWFSNISILDSFIIGLMYWIFFGSKFNKSS